MTPGAGDPITLRQWTHVVRRARLGRTVKAVALALATYADPDGSRVHPGLARLAVECELTYNVVQGALATLRTAGLIALVRKAQRRNDSDEYRLTLADDVLDRVDVLTPAQVLLAAEQLRVKHRGKYRPKAPEPGPDGGPDEQPAPHAEGCSTDDLHPTAHGAEGLSTDGSAPHGVTAETPPAPHGVVDLHPTPLATTSHGPKHKNHLPDDTALRTAVTVPAHPQAAQDPLFAEVVDTPQPKPKAARCQPHGLAAGLRDDDQPRCPLCRVEARITAGRNLRAEVPGIHPAIVELAADGYFDDDGEPFTDEPLAPVVPIRRAS